MSSVFDHIITETVTVMVEAKKAARLESERERQNTVAAKQRAEAKVEKLEDLVEEINEEKGHGGKTWTISGWCRYAVMKALVAKDKPQPQFQA